MLLPSKIRVLFIQSLSIFQKDFNRLFKIQFSRFLCTYEAFYNCIFSNFPNTHYKYQYQ